MLTYYLAPWSPHSSRTMAQPVGFNGGRRLPLNVQDLDDSYVVTAAVPGLKAEELEVEMLDDVLTLRGEVKRAENGDDGEALLEEIGFGEFSRSLRLPAPVEAAKAEASVENGLLTVRIPKAEEARPKSIKIRAK